MNGSSAILWLHLGSGLLSAAAAWMWWRTAPAPRQKLAGWLTGAGMSLAAATGLFMAGPWNRLVGPELRLLDPRLANVFLTKLHLFWLALMLLLAAAALSRFHGSQGPGAGWRRLMLFMLAAALTAMAVLGFWVGSKASLSGKQWMAVHGVRNA
ncbi:MAG: hypothetical protein GMKNLPBB_00501 [Myxococcota bacterium]|nr:hypothetical protein [Myxococcota bacterium]